MKLFLLIFSIIMSTQSDAKSNYLLQCLAKEEELLHKNKDQSSLYRLNQNFLNELSTNNDITLKKNFIEEICNDKTTSPSVGFLKLLLLKESDVYDLSLSETDKSMRPYKMGYIKEFQKQVPHLLISYFTGLQAEITDPHCLNRAIPEIVKLTEKLKYLEDEISIHRIIDDKKNIEIIFKKLKNFKSIKSACNLKSQKELDGFRKKNQETNSGKN